MIKSKFLYNYSWVVLVMGIFVVFGALGLARYGYTMVLPSMQVELGMNNSQAGLLAAFNLAGYLIFALIGGALAARFGIRVIASLGLLFAGAGMIFTGMAGEFISVALWRTVTGLGSGSANVAIMGLWAAWFSQNKRGFAAGIAVSGSSFGLIFTGLLVPGMAAGYGDMAWRYSWFVFGGIAVALAVCAFVVLRNNPGETGFNLFRAGGDHTGDQSMAQSGLLENVYLSPVVWSLGFVYTAFGFSYIIYMTFFVKFLSDFGYTTTAAGNLFMSMGWLSLICGIIWGSVSDRIGRKNALLIIFLIHTAAFGLFGLGGSPVTFTISAILYGISAWSIPAIMAATCGDILGSKLAPAALGFITLFFGIGQALGPIVGGAMADMAGSFSSAFLLASGVAFAGFISSAILLKDARNAGPEHLQPPVGE